MSSASRALLWRWYENPERACVDDDSYSDLSLINPSYHPDWTGRYKMSRTNQIETKRLSCLSCVVYYDCLKDLLAHKDQPLFGIRAGIVGRP